MAHLTAATTEVENLLASSRFYGWIPPHGKEVSAGGKVTLDGNLWARIKSKRAMDSLQTSLSNGEVAINRLPTAPATA